MNVTANDDDNYYNNQSRLITGYAIFFSRVFFCSLIISFHSFDVLVVCKECHTTIIIIIIKSDEREKNMSDLVTFNLSASKDFNWFFIIIIINSQTPRIQVQSFRTHTHMSNSNLLRFYFHYTWL